MTYSRARTVTRVPHPVISAVSAALGAGHDLAAIESALVQAFCEEQGLTPAHGGVLARTIEPTPGADDARAALAGVGPLNLDALVMAFETLVPASEAVRYGAVFTPEAITSFMARESLDRLTSLGVDLTAATVIDPAVGCGALLVAALRAIIDRTHESPHAVCERLYGADVSADSVARARVLLALTTLYLGDPVEPDLGSRMVVADALLSDWVATFGRATFSLVLGNPPYVRYQHLDAPQRAALAARWASCGKGNFNLYFPFFEVAHQLADPTGSVVAFITPNAFLSSLSGGPLRTWMVTTRYLDDVLDFGHHRVFEALTYTAVTFARRGVGARADAFGYTAVEGLDGLANLPNDWAATRSVTTPYAGLSAAPWKLVGKSAAGVVGRLRHTGTTVAEVADVRFGVATCRDKLYLLRGDLNSRGNYNVVYNSVTYEIEPGATRPCTRVSSVANSTALANDRTRILYPYTLNGGRATVLDEDVLAATYPGAHQYLCAVRGELARRDGGKKTYAAWYAYARTQGLVPSGEKLLTPLYAGRPRFLHDAREDALFINGCAVTRREDAPDWVTLELLEVLLNSGLFHYFVESTAHAIDGGFFAYQKSQIGPFGLVEMAPDEVAALVARPPHDRDLWLAQRYGVPLPAPYVRA